MIFLLGCLLFVAVSIVAFRKIGVIYPYSKGVALAGGASLLAAICLAQNYTQSLIPNPEVNDGIAISNRVAYWIIGEDGWSIEIFRNSFNQSISLTLCLLTAYPFVLVVESKFIKKATNA